LNSAEKITYGNEGESGIAKNHNDQIKNFSTKKLPELYGYDIPNRRSIKALQGMMKRGKTCSQRKEKWPLPPFQMRIQVGVYRKSFARSFEEKADEWLTKKNR
jgi:hypothetical protein